VDGLGDIIAEIITMVAKGNAGAFTAVLLLVIAALGWNAIHIGKQMDKLDTKLFRILDDYGKAQITTAEAMNMIRDTLNEIKNRID